MAKQFTNVPFTNGLWGVHIYTDFLESVQRTFAAFAFFVHLLHSFGTYLQNLYFSLPTSFWDDHPPLYHCFKTYTLQSVNITCCVGRKCITWRSGKQKKLLYLNQSHSFSSPRNILVPKCLSWYEQIPSCGGYLVILMQTLKVAT